MNIKILGSGCSNCKKLYNLTIEVVNKLNIQVEIDKIENIKDIMSYGVMRTPALVINEKVKVYGRIPNSNEIEKYIKEEL